MSEGPLVLVVDDNATVRETVETVLGWNGYRTAAAANGRAALALVHSLAPDVVLTDMLMPEMEGVETVRAIRKLHPGVKIIAMSGGGHGPNAQDVLKLAKALGADLTLEKPFGQQPLLAALRTVLGLPPQQDRTS